MPRTQPPERAYRHEEAELVALPAYADMPRDRDAPRAEAARRLAQQIDAQARDCLTMAEQLGATLRAARTRRRSAWAQRQQMKRKRGARVAT